MSMHNTHRHVALGTPLFDMRNSEKTEMEKFGNSRMHMMELAWKKAFAAEVVRNDFK